MFQELDPQMLRTLLDSNPQARLIDVRTPAEVGRGAIPGARNIPLHMLPIAAAEMGDDVATIVYCQSGARSAQACMFLSSRGHRNVYNLRGGILGWQQSGLPTAPLG